MFCPDKTTTCPDKWLSCVQRRRPRRSPKFLQPHCHVPDREAPARGCDTGAVEHYAEAFTVTYGRPFRMVQIEGVGRAKRCPGPVVWRGRFRTPGEQIYRVDACEGHGSELHQRTRVSTRRARPEG